MLSTRFTPLRDVGRLSHQLESDVVYGFRTSTGIKLHVIGVEVWLHLMVIDDVDDILDVCDKFDGTEYGALRYTAVDWVVCQCFTRVMEWLPTIAEIRTKPVQGSILHIESTRFNVQGDPMSNVQYDPRTWYDERYENARVFFSLSPVLGLPAFEKAPIQRIANIYNKNYYSFFADVKCHYYRPILEWRHTLVIHRSLRSTRVWIVKCLRYIVGERVRKGHNFLVKLTSKLLKNLRNNVHSSLKWTQQLSELKHEVCWVFNL